MAYRAPSGEEEDALRAWLVGLGFESNVDFRALHWDDICKKNRRFLKSLKQSEGATDLIKRCNTAKNLFEQYFVASNRNKQSFDVEDEEKMRTDGYNEYRKTLFHKIFHEEDANNAAASSSGSTRPAATENVFSKPAASTTIGVTQTWDEAGAGRCQGWPHGCALKQIIAKRGEERAKEYVFLYACSEHCWECAEFLLREENVSIGCISTGKDGRAWAMQGKQSKKKNDFLEMWDTYAKWHN